MSSVPPPTPPPPPPAQPPLLPMQAPLPLGGFPPTGEPRNGMAVAALVLGILGLVLCPIGPLLGLVALALGS